MVKQGDHALIQDNHSWVKYVKYSNFTCDYEWVLPYSPYVPASVERTNRPSSRGVTTFYLKYAYDCNIRVNAFILVCFGLSVPHSLRVFRALFVLQKHGSWYSVEKRSRSRNNFSIIIAEGLSGWHKNWVWVDVDEDILPHNMLDMDVFSLLVEYNNKGVVDIFELFIPPEENPSGVDQAGGSGSEVSGEELNSLSTPVVPLSVTPLMSVYPISDDDEAEKTVDVEADVASGSNPNDLCLSNIYK
nr:hypothetical protein [Tanacetum cinerariifolium]